MYNSFGKRRQHRQGLHRSLIATFAVGSSLLSQCWFVPTAEAKTKAYCHFTQEAIAQKESLRVNSLKNNSDSKISYQTIIQEHASFLQQCRSQTWPQNQAIWVRLYPCDARPGALEETLDRIVNQGYNQVYVEVFYDGRVLLPKADNRTPWPSVIQQPGTENVDLLAQAIQKGRDRGLQVYAWMFTMNFGYTYGHRAERQQILARNGQGETSLSVVKDGSQVFIDPYNRQAQVDYYEMLKGVLKRRPDGILFDYIRYPRGSGSQSVASSVKDLWIYSDAAKQALYQRAGNNQGKELIRRYLSKGSISAKDIKAVKKLYPDEKTPLWQGRTPSARESTRTIQWQLWQLSVAHAAQGILDFLKLGELAAERAGVQAGAVFFPDGNQVVGRMGYDSRLQPWEHFPRSLEWHPMSYGVCGHTGCIANLVKRVFKWASSETDVKPALAGTWGRSIKNRPSLENQMQALRRVTPQINSVSHFAFSWQDPEFDRERKFCRL
ncbi:MAG: family 10 glycosylhydrolase [Moorea sp. SIO3C2]|nr:family 10 glycosylhydrolase [Moorena sp. SIO3C2]